MRMKKRRRRRWKRRMRARELLRRMFDDFSMEVRGGFLPNYQFLSTTALKDYFYPFTVPFDSSFVLTNSQAFNPENVTTPRRNEARNAATL
jgi:hypothetical protein